MTSSFVKSFGLRWSLWLGLAACALALPARAASEATGAALLDAWQLEDAMGIAADVLAAHPQSPTARAFAAEVMHQRGQHEAALALLGEGRLADADAGDAVTFEALPQGAAARLAEMLPQLRGSAHYAATFRQRLTPHFHIHYQDKDEIVAVLAEDVLEAAYARIGGDLGPEVAGRGERIGVEIYPDAQGLAKATGLTPLNIEDSGTIAVCKYHRLMLISPLATLTGYLWADTLAHELTHLIISKLSHNHVPIWLHEGIAKYYETRWRDAAGTGLTAHAAQLLGRAVRDDALIPFSRMHPSMAKLPNQHDAALAFAEVFAMVEFLHQTRGPKVIARALAALGRGVSLNDVLVEYLGGTLPQLEANLRRQLKKRRFDLSADVGPDDDTIRLAPLTTTGPDARAQSLGPVADPQAKDWLRLGDMLALRGHPQAAIDPYRRAYARVGTHLPLLGYRLADALSDAGHSAQAIAIVSETLKAHPMLTEAQLLLGRLQAQAGAWAKTLAPLRAYCLRNPYNPEVHALWRDAAAHLGDAQTQSREAHFAALCEAPRAIVKAPEPPPGAGRLRLVTVPWVPVYIDDDPVPCATPLWDRAIAPGPHRLRVAPNGPIRTIDVRPNRRNADVWRLGGAAG